MRIRVAALLLALQPGAGAAQAPAPDLYTVELIGTPELRRFSGIAELRPARSPFTAPVTAGGVHRFEVLVSADSLPDPASLGPYSTYVVWVAPPTLEPMRRLGELYPGRPASARLGEIALNRFLLFVSAEASPEVAAPAGPVVLRGFSPSMRLGAPHLVQASDLPLAHGQHGGPDGWRMPPAHPQASAMYMPALAGLSPNAAPFSPAWDSTVPPVKPRSYLRLDDGDSLRLEAGPVRRMVGGKARLMYGFNGEQPGPLIEVRHGGVTIHVNFVNRTALPSAVHWHGVRLDNRFDGVPHLTQPPVAPGDSFRYEVRLPDAGIYWYHPHHREDVQQDLGLYGNILVRDGGGGPVHREEVLMLDDLLVDAGGLIPHGRERATHALMGRFGNLLLINGEPAASYRLAVRRGEVVRFYLTNAANARPFNLSFPAGAARMKLVGSDLGRPEREEWLESIVLAPAERYIVDVAFERAGSFPLLNRVQAIDHTLGRFFAEEDTLGMVRVGAEEASPDLRARFAELRRNADVAQEIAPYRAEFARPPDATLTLSLADRGLPFALVQLLRFDTLFVNPVEWSGTMPMMDWLATSDQVTWTLTDRASGRVNEAIGWQFRRGDRVRLRLVNDRHTLHPMAHPIHLHGQRFLVLSVNGRPTENYLWKDTVLVPVGSVVELLVEMTNPGRWMLHCHIAEHLEAGMRMVFVVE